MINRLKQDDHQDRPLTNEDKTKAVTRLCWYIANGCTQSELVKRLNLPDDLVDSMKSFLKHAKGQLFTVSGDPADPVYHLTPFGYIAGAYYHKNYIQTPSHE